MEKREILHILNTYQYRSPLNGSYKEGSWSSPTTAVWQVDRSLVGEILHKKFTREIIRSKGRKRLRTVIRK